MPTVVPHNPLRGYPGSQERRQEVCLRLLCGVGQQSTLSICYNPEKKNKACVRILQFERIIVFSKSYETTDGV